MKAGFSENHWNDVDGNPSGGCSWGCGFTISWQNGPLGRGGGRSEPSGAFVEDVIAAAGSRLEYYEGSKFTCEENRVAIEHLSSALEVLKSRTADRDKRQVEGTHAV